MALNLAIVIRERLKYGFCRVMTAW